MLRSSSRPTATISWLWLTQAAVINKNIARSGAWDFSDTHNSTPRAISLSFGVQNIASNIRSSTKLMVEDLGCLVAVRIIRVVDCLNIISLPVIDVYFSVPASSMQRLVVNHPTVGGPYCFISLLDRIDSTITYWYRSCGFQIKFCNQLLLRKLEFDATCSLVRELITCPSKLKYGFWLE